MMGNHDRRWSYLQLKFVPCILRWPLGTLMNNICCVMRWFNPSLRLLSDCMTMCWPLAEIWLRCGRLPYPSCLLPTGLMLTKVLVIRPNDCDVEPPRIGFSSSLAFRDVPLSCVSRYQIRVEIHLVLDSSFYHFMDFLVWNMRCRLCPAERRTRPSGI